MAYTPTRIYQGQLSNSEITATPGILSSAVPASTTWIVKEILICNTSNSTNTTISLSIVPTGSTGGSSNRVISNLTVKAGSTTSFGLSTVMTTGDFISAVAGVSGTVTVTISGVVIS